jgi:ribosomal subunit interface protein
MELIIKSRNGKLSERQRTYIDEKLQKLERHLDHESTATVEISSEKRRNQKNEVHRLQITLMGEHGVILRAEQSGDDLFRTVDEVQDVLQRQIKRYKDKHWRRSKLRRKSGEMVSSESPGVPTQDSANEEPRIVRVKEFKLKPMFTDEAIEQMELLEHSFFIFRDADTAQISMVYRRNDGNYGLIIPEEVQ